MSTSPAFHFDFSVTEEELRASRDFGVRRAQLEPFFDRGFAALATEMRTKRAFLVHVFFVSLGKHLVAGGLAQDDRELIKGYLAELAHGRGYRPIHPDAPRANLKRTTSVPADIYATAYAARLFALCEGTLPDISETARWVFSLQQESGWIYDPSWADTREDRKFHQELAVQMLQAIFLLKLQETEQLGREQHEAATRALRGLLEKTWYMGTLADVVQALSLLGCAFSDNDFARIAAFLDSHFETESGGFYEYRFENAKLSAQTGAMQRYGSDYRVPSVPATFNALRLLHWLREGGRGIERSHRDGVERFFADLAPGNGFGTRVQIAKYPASFGPVTSAYESLMVLAAPALLGKVEV